LKGKEVVIFHTFTLQEVKNLGRGMPESVVVEDSQP
jgi:hypothetical protein